MQAFVPKNRRPRFEFILRIIDLNNVPLVSGTAFVKWRLPSSSTAEHHGQTDKAIIIDHRAYWNYEKTLQVRLTIDRNQTLHECELVLDIIQEFGSGGHGEKNLLGRIRLNLAEYVDKSDDEEGIVRRYLMQDSKVNSTLRVGIVMRQIDGDRNFTTPPLRSAAVFAGIAGVVSSEKTDHDELGRLPSINTQSREVADMQDMYRRTLAAAWLSGTDDIPADKLIEDLFATGSCGNEEHPDARSRRTADNNNELHPDRDTDTRQTRSGNRLSPSFERRPKSLSSQFRNESKGSDSSGHIRKGGSIQEQLYDSANGRAWKSRSEVDELSEFDRDAFVRYQNTATDPEDEPPSRRRPRARWANQKELPRGQKVTLDVESLGKPGEIVVVPHRTRRRQNSEVKRDTSDKSALPFMLEDIEIKDVVLESATINESIQSFREPHCAHDKLSANDWEDLRNRLQSSFTFQQLSDYIQEAKQEALVQKDGEPQSEHLSTAVWRPGTSMFLETGPVSRGSFADRVAVTQALKGKQLLAERILRDCWQLGVAGEVGQIDIRLPAYSLSLLLNSEHFSFEELASLHDAKIDVTRSLGLIRVTGNQHTCESIREIIYDATNRIRQEDVYLPTPNNATSKSGHIFTPDFLAWASKTYGVAFEQEPSQGVIRMFYLAENREDADNARRTLNLAIYNTTSPAIPFGTYLSATQSARVYDVDPEQNVPWFDRQKAWFRWAMSSTQSSETKILDTPYFDKHQSLLSDELLKLLRKSSPSSELNGISETVVAAIGQCLFLRKPSFETQTLSASQLGKLNLPRTFTTDVPRVTSFLRTLKPRLPDDDQQFYVFRLIPTTAHANIFPRLELEVTLPESNPSSVPDAQIAIRSVKAELAESNVDYLLPENGLDLRFTRKLYRDLLHGLSENESAANVTVESLREYLQGIFSRYMNSEGEAPLPVFTRVPLPNDLLKGTVNSELDNPGNHTTAEYMFMPVNDLRGTRIHRYDFNGQQLNYAFYESGPFNPYRTTDIFLDMDLTEGDSSTSPPAEDSMSPNPLHRGFNKFYGAACSLAFELDRAWRIDSV
ncbi:hypothetical protein CNMCM6936_006132 [Aspergillus lentulus]|uniref:C2 NT-type domain-containing protein n=1 Tax=Aspergillus lentulus TaxID=293939 RepID=A0AAN6BTJ0_ASPLE|nr:hypothetical protein CNMCM6069_005212 [Aspergillus lentulus]KAF4169896.1 hypothetical protein CNMCM6936_006132 [Aspergillus lentulus]KAF4183129.1 hypothetical protein CNMCM8060_005156 [Aspergillus lentulus]KAF4190481.1 hypothetical protein CNMCM7927_003451 [Aspergillus lentulus]KAF4199444.1 hypothetical protein CNMCM8694_005117 [Aspergillus lentulus]